MVNHAVGGLNNYMKVGIVFLVLGIALLVFFAYILTIQLSICFTPGVVCQPSFIEISDLALGIIFVIAGLKGDKSNVKSA